MTIVERWFAEAMERGFIRQEGESAEEYLRRVILALAHQK